MKILFLCVANCARSQVAEGVAKKILKDHEIESAGSHPSGWVHPAALQVLREIGVDPTEQHSKAWTDLDQRFLAQCDYVISLCAEESCPTAAIKAKRLHWPMTDPTGTGSNHEDVVKNFRKLRDEIEKRISELKLK